MLFSAFINHLKDFFKAHTIEEVYTPLLNQSVCIEPHLELIRAYSALEDRHYVLPTSPEFGLKKLIAQLGKDSAGIFEISHAFRDEKLSPWHKHEFYMLEFYLRDKSYLELGPFCQKLIQHAGRFWPHRLEIPSLEIISFDELVSRFCGIDFPACKIDYVAEKIDFDHNSWHNFLVKSQSQGFINEQVLEVFEKKLGDIYSIVNLFTDVFSLTYDYILQNDHSLKNKLVGVVDFPAYTRGMSKLHHHQCQRIELILNSVEIGNGYQEIDDAAELESLFLFNNKLRQNLGKKPFVFDDELIQTSPHLQTFSGMAIGLDRLYQVLGCL